MCTQRATNSVSEDDFRSVQHQHTFYYCSVIDLHQVELNS